jgi:vacuolar-type H+-ATPase subunit D/Vma8
MDNLSSLAALFTAILSGFGVLYLNSRTITREEISRLQDRIVALEAYRDKLESKYEELYRHHLELQEDFSTLKSLKNQENSGDTQDFKGESS